ncbi:helix-turn-helix transcriptional regulator [Aquincola sp. S2]|uniref:Helix-turn-helix transcriptional regulator n=1 Tax=Pseudaquabacterium terrae TaxID=2732868 RepID=A0ABX2ENQ3_9BURK|nr:helix-turn-helix transcriptional regulator [Aquabacterium terrae]NRF70276.1 helix-turn-helix transcriptional regulator [Aquabacterium terrae]
MSIANRVNEWRVLARRHPLGTVLPVHQHQTAQLVFAITGVMLVEAGDSRWTVPPQRALWIPPDEPHSIRMLSDTALRTVYFQPAFVDEHGTFRRRAAVHVVMASGLIRELVLGLFDEQRGHGMQSLTARLLLHALDETACLPTQLPMPDSADLHRAALRLIESNAWHLSLSDLAEAAAVSERSFSRRFTAEAGISFRAWRQRARLIASLDLLAGDQSIKAIAHKMGFQNPAAYSTAFGELFGQPPQEFRGGAMPLSNLSPPVGHVAD